MVLVSHDFVIHKLIKADKKLRMVWVMMILGLSHSFHIWIYAFTYYIAVHLISLGTIEGCTCENIIDFAYFAGANYTSLGYGDFIPTHGMRLMSVMTGLIGLMMIGWSTAFAFWWMQRHWMKIKKDKE